MPGPTGRTHHATRGRGPGQWWPALNDKGWTATLYCPECQMPFDLRDHTIDRTGVVTPSVVCGVHERDRCFHDNVVLVEWSV